MKTKLSNEQAQKAVKKFAYASIISSAVSIVLFWWLSIVGMFFGIRALLLTQHPGNTNDKKLVMYKSISAFGIIIGMISWYLYSNSHN